MVFAVAESDSTLSLKATLIRVFKKQIKKDKNRMIQGA
jgi:hypothetical protein